MTFPCDITPLQPQNALRDAPSTASPAEFTEEHDAKTATFFEESDNVTRDLNRLIQNTTQSTRDSSGLCGNTLADLSKFTDSSDENPWTLVSRDELQISNKIKSAVS